MFNELQFFLDHKVPQVKFVDRTFNCKHDHAMAIWKYIQEHDNGITKDVYKRQAYMFRFAGFRQSHFLCNLCNLIHSDGNCLTVAFACVVVMLFDCVCQSVTKVQEHALAGVEMCIRDRDSSREASM